MSAVDDAIEAGARELLRQTVTARPDSASESEWERARRIVRRLHAEQWPVLSAGLRELHTRWDQGGGWVVCMHCNDNTSPPRKKQWPCETITELDRIDRELGIEADHQSGDPESGRGEA